MVRRVLRPRVLIYFGVLLAISAAMITSLALRMPLKVDVVRDRASLSRLVAGGKLENSFSLQIMNATEEAHRYRISAVGLDGLEVASEPEVEVEPAQARWVATRLQIPYGSAEPGSHTIYFKVEALGATHVQVQEKAVFLVPR